MVYESEAVWWRVWSEVFWIEALFSAALVALLIFIGISDVTACPDLAGSFSLSTSLGERESSWGAFLEGSGRELAL